MKSTVDSVGAFGFVLLGLEYAGFVLGSVLPVAYGKAKPDCANCKRFYKKGAGFAVSPSLENGEVTDPASSEDRALIERNEGILRAENEKIKAALQGKSFEEKLAHLGQVCAKGVTRNAFYLTFSVQNCPSCGNHIISSTLNSHVNKDGGMVTEDLGELSVSP